MAYLDLDSNGLTGAIPPELGDSLAELRALSLANNPELVGPAPVSLANLTRLEDLWLPAEWPEAHVREVEALTGGRLSCERDPANCAGRTACWRCTG